MLHQDIEHLDSDFVAMKIAESEVPMERGHDPNRFILQVKRDLLCFICHRVLKEPRICEAGEHHFCSICITQHLAKQSQTCPECKKPLTLETLQLPQKFLINILSELRIRCDYNDRGCPEHVQLGNLEDHVIGCEYRPTMVAEKYSSLVSGKDQQNFRQMKDEEFSKGAEKNEFSKRQNEMRETKIETERKPEEIVDLDEVLCQSLDTVKRSRPFAETGDKVTKKHDDMQEELKIMKTNVNKLTPSQAELNIQHLQITRKQYQIEARQDQIEARQDETKKALDEIKQTQSGIHKRVKKMEGSFEVIKQQLERLEGLLGHLFKENIVNRDGAQATDPTIPTNNQDVIIVGGWYDHGEAPPLKTVEKYNIVEKRSTMLPPLNHLRTASASCVYNNDILVVGGYDGKEGTDKIEVLKMNQHPLRWTMFGGKLPVKLADHDVIVYSGKFYIIGGHDWNEREISNAIYEIALTPPYTAKLLTRMPEPRTFHRAEFVNGKIFILGGKTTHLSKDAFDSVVLYDLIKNELKPCTSLPQPVCHMSTVTWGDKIIVLGGENKNAQALNDVIMYDTETGQIEPLPSMIYKRSGSSAVIMNDVIVVFGGRNNEQGYLNSVETFTIGGDGWKELPGMIEKRCWATAVVKPHI
ncbi:uncharacterized protein LOC114538418 isoform X2 [Dendronephthya gigantea]|uniref:uncharacterized protein LOC114538418 isoform X2 n=1 Tax=Dendronephthya gigantea TaxID=151771 RepID=UPI00106BAFE8|nr:uncharacterized protein LOC114538418 isoform X2 [Dendronephthya gigantea]